MQLENKPRNGSITDEMGVVIVVKYVDHYYRNIFHICQFGLCVFFSFHIFIFYGLYILSLITHCTVLSANGLVTGKTAFSAPHDQHTLTDRQKVSFTNFKIQDGGGYFEKLQYLRNGWTNFNKI